MALRKVFLTFPLSVVLWLVSSRIYVCCLDDWCMEETGLSKWSQLCHIQTATRSSNRRCQRNTDKSISRAQIYTNGIWRVAGEFEICFWGTFNLICTIWRLLSLLLLVLFFCRRDFSWQKLILLLPIILLGRRYIYYIL